MSFLSSRGGARLARHLAVRRLAEWGIPRDGDVSHTVALLVSELAANAVCHGHVSGGEFHLLLTVQPAGGDGPRGEVVRVEVSDACGERRPVLRRVEADAGEHGRGLVLVDALASAWGVEGGGAGKTVWCEYVLPVA